MPLKVRESRGECIDFQRCILNKENSVSDLLFRKHLIKCLFIPSHVLDAKATKMNHVWPCPCGAHCLVKEKRHLKRHHTSEMQLCWRMNGAREKRDHFSLVGVESRTGCGEAGSAFVNDI